VGDIAKCFSLHQKAIAADWITTCKSVPLAFVKRALVISSHILTPASPFPVGLAADGTRGELRVIHRGKRRKMTSEIKFYAPTNQCHRLGNSQELETCSQYLEKVQCNRGFKMKSQLCVTLEAITWKDFLLTRQSAR
jgi:hypothetical protein